MFKFLEKQLKVIKDNDADISSRVTSYNKAKNKLNKIKTILQNVQNSNYVINEKNLDETLQEIDLTLNECNIDAMTTEDLIKIIELKNKIDSCKTFLTTKQLTKICVHNKNGNINDITGKIKEGLFIEQIQPKKSDFDDVIE